MKTQRWEEAHGGRVSGARSREPRRARSIRTSPGGTDPRGDCRTIACKPAPAHAERAADQKSEQARGCAEVPDDVGGAARRWHSAGPSTLRPSASSATMCQHRPFHRASRARSCWIASAERGPGAANREPGRQQGSVFANARTARHSRRFANAAGAPESLRRRSTVDHGDDRLRARPERMAAPRSPKMLAGTAASPADQVTAVADDDRRVGPTRRNAREVVEGR